MNYAEWAARHPAAAAELHQMLDGSAVSHEANGKLEAWAQQQVRLKVAQHFVETAAGPVHAMGWRNNVGAIPAKEPCVCPRCSFKFDLKRQPFRYGLANDSAKLNATIKSGDLILAIPRMILPQHVGQVIAQFGSIETKRPGWRYTGKGQEPGQMAWNSLITRLGGYATFSTGEVQL